MRPVTGFAVLLTVLACLAVPAGAQLIMNPSSSCDIEGIEIGPSLSYSKIKYVFDNDDEVDVERIMTGLYGAWGLTDWFDLYVSFGFIAKAEPEPDDGDWGDSGDGFLVGAGIRGLNYENDYLTVMSYAQVSFIDEDYGEASDSVTIDEVTTRTTTDLSAEIFDVTLGVVAKGYVTDMLSLYGGVEFIPYTDGKAKFNSEVSDGGSTGGKEDFERDIPVTVRGGANYEFETWWLRAEVGLISETSFLLGAGFLF